MIAFGSLVSDRQETIRYLVQDRVDPARSRVAYARGINVATDDPYTAVALMRMVSDAQRQSRRPGYHLSISFSGSDREHLSVELMERIARYLMQRLGIPSHMAILVVHEDRGHAHFHLLIDRRHPDRQVLWPEPSWRQLHHAARHAERHFGLQEVPSHLAKLPDQSWPQRDESMPTGVRRALERATKAGQGKAASATPRTLEPDEMPFMLRARGDLKPYFEQRMPQSWGVLEEAMARIGPGYRLVRRPRGLAVTDGHEHCSLSRVSRHASLPKFEQCFGQAYDDYRAELEQTRGARASMGSAAEARGVEIASAARRVTVTSSAAPPAVTVTDSTPPPAVTVTSPPAAPPPAPVVETAARDRHGAALPPESVEKGASSPPTPPLDAPAEHLEPTRAAAEGEGSTGPALPRGLVEGIRGALSALERVDELEPRRRQLRTQVLEGKRALGDLERAKLQDGLCLEKFGRAMEWLYGPAWEVARDRLYAEVRRARADSAIRTLGSTPERYGELRGAGLPQRVRKGLGERARTADRSEVMLRAGTAASAAQAYAAAGRVLAEALGKARGMLDLPPTVREEEILSIGASTVERATHELVLADMERSTLGAARPRETLLYLLRGVPDVARPHLIREMPQLESFFRELGDGLEQGGRGLEQ